MRLLGVLWAVIVVAMGCYLGYCVATGITLETRILSMLPPGRLDPVAAAAEERITEGLTRRLLLLIAHHDAERARDAAARAVATLADRGVADPEVAGAGADQARAMLQHFSAFAPQLLATADREDLQAGRSEAVAARALGRVMAPLQPIDGALLMRDPLLLSAAFLADLPRPSGRLTPHGSFLEGREGNRHVALIALRLRGDPFAGPTQDAVVQALDRVRHDLAQSDPGFDMRAAGAVLYAQAGNRDAIGDLSRLGTIDTIITLALLFAVFHGIGAILLIALPVSVGILAGFAAMLAVFPVVHSLALVFGTTLIGTAIDYAIHYTTARFAVAGPDRRLRLVIIGTALGMITTLFGYFAIAASPFPALQQLAVFSLAGLIAAWLTMVLWLPRFDSSPKVALPPAVPRLRAWLALNARPITFAGLALGGALAVIGLLRFDVSDDLRRFQSLAPELRSAEAEIRRASGIDLAPVVLTIAARDEQEALRIEEATRDRLRRHGLDADGVSRYLPSAARQQENRALVRDRLPLAALGPLGGVLERRLGEPAPELSFQQMPPALAARLSDLRTMTGDGRVVHILRVFEGDRRGAVQSAVAGLEGVTMLDLTRRIGEGFAAQRRDTLLLLALIAAATLAIATWRYGWRHGVVTTVPPALAILLTPLWLAAIGEPFSFFNAIGLLLVISLGIDYAFYWAESAAEHRDVTALAVVLSTLMTVVAFGLLVFSRTEALRGFGATVAVGTLLSAALAPLAARRAR